MVLIYFMANEDWEKTGDIYLCEIKINWYSKKLLIFKYMSLLLPLFLFFS